MEAITPNLKRQKLESTSFSVTKQLHFATPTDRVAAATPNEEEEENATPKSSEGRMTLQSKTCSDSQAAAVVVTPKRESYLKWDEYFMAAALLSAQRSKDPESPMGACIVDPNNRIVGLGYNGFPQGCQDVYLPWASTADDVLHTKEYFVVDAASNAILNSITELEGCSIYVMRYPSSDVAKEIIQSRIRNVIVLKDDTIDNKESQLASKTSDRIASERMLDMAGVQVSMLRPTRTSILLDFQSALKMDTASIAAARDRQNAMDKQETNIPQEVRELLHEELHGYDPTGPSVQPVRPDYISWDDYFMGMAFLTAQRSKDPSTQVGACIVDARKRIVGLGYNGFPVGCSDDVLPWAKGNTDAAHNKYAYVVHAELNALLNKCNANLEGTTLYVALFPCENCTKRIIQAGIKEVVYMSDQYHDTPGCRASRVMLGLRKVKLRQYIPSMDQMTLKFDL